MEYNMQNNSHKQEIKQRILDTASKLFTQKGIRQVKMDDIAHALKISKRTLYEVYDNKEQLLMDVVKMRDEQHVKLFEEFSKKGANAIEIIAAFYHFQMKDFSTINPAFFIDMDAYENILEYFHSKREKHRRDRRKFILQAVKDGYFIDNVDYDIIDNVMEGTSEFVINTNMYSKYGFAALFHNIIMVFLRGICTEKGLKELKKFMENTNER